MDNKVALVQGIYFFITGIWPILSMSTFLKITVPKTDLWLVKTVGLVLATIGAVLIYAQFTAHHIPCISRRRSCRTYAHCLVDSGFIISVGANHLFGLLACNEIYLCG